MNKSLFAIMISIIISVFSCNVYAKADPSVISAAQTNATPIQLAHAAWGRHTWCERNPRQCARERAFCARNPRQCNGNRVEIHHHHHKHHRQHRR